MAEEVIIEAAADGAATNGGATLTAATDHVLALANKSRERLIVTADVADVWLSYGSGAAVSGQGIRVKAGTGPFEERDWKGDVHCISAGAAVVGIIETSYQAGDDQGEHPTGGDTFTPSGPSDGYSSQASASAAANPAKPGVPWPPQT